MTCDLGIALLVWPLFQRKQRGKASQFLKIFSVGWVTLPLSTAVCNTGFCNLKRLNQDSLVGSNVQESLSERRSASFCIYQISLTLALEQKLAKNHWFLVQ